MNQNQKKNRTEQIWRELSDRLRQFVQARVTSASDIDDILQTVFLRIHTRFDDLRHADRLEAWVFQITRNAVTDYFRRKKGGLQDGVESLSDKPNSNQGENANTELANCLGSLIDRLPTDQRRALSMYELDGMSQKDIATRESISLSGAKSRIQRGRKALEHMLKACCEFQFDRRGNVLAYEPTSSECCLDARKCR